MSEVYPSFKAIPLDLVARLGGDSVSICFLFLIGTFGTSSSSSSDWILRLLLDFFLILDSSSIAYLLLLLLLIGTDGTSSSSSSSSGKGISSSNEIFLDLELCFDDYLLLFCGVYTLGLLWMLSLCLLLLLAASITDSTAATIAGSAVWRIWLEVSSISWALISLGSISSIACVTISSRPFTMSIWCISQ